MRARVTDDLLCDMIDEYEAGCSVDAIAEDCGVGRTTVYAWLRQAGVFVPRRAQRIDSTRIAVPVEDLVRRYEAGESQNALAQAYGVSRIVVALRLREAGVCIRGVGEANRIVMARRSPQEHRHNTAAARAAAMAANRRLGRAPALRTAANADPAG